MDGYYGFAVAFSSRRLGGAGRRHRRRQRRDLQRRSEVAAAPRVATTGTNTPWAQSIATTGGLAAGTYQFRAFIDDPASVDQVSVTVVPEPASLSLLGVGGLALLHRRRRD